ncbi:MAG: DUF58 domain-containing protein [Gemmatimonadaceae bacterium]|nr:DUF58 domain-containing protein [Gemmatimonadaceae bacterium]
MDAAVKPAPHGSVLAPEVVAAIEDLELSARLVVEGMRTGGNRSPFHGYSTEFRQHRPYRAGDDLKYLDWKLFGRSDRLYTRQFRDTTNVPVMLVLDSSGSMDFPAAAGSASVTKFRYAVVMAAALAHLASTQGNAVGLMTMEQGALRYMPARGGRPHLRALLAMLERLAPAARWDARLVIDRAAQLLRRRGLVAVISDFYDDEAEVTRALRRVTQHGHDVSVLHVLSPAELALGDSGAIEYEDIETGERRLVDAGAAAVAYAQRIESFAAGRRDDAVHSGITYARLVTDVPPGRALRDFLQRRGGARGTERIPGGAR